MSFLIRKNSEQQKTKAFAEYERGKSFLDANLSLFEKTDRAYRFRDGDQWSGIKKPKGEVLPVLNVIKAILLYKISIVCQQGMDANFTSNDFRDSATREAAIEICRKINNDYKKYWENNNMDAMLWEVVGDGGTVGETFTYSIPDTEVLPGVEIEGVDTNRKVLKNIEVRQIERTNIFFGDENTPDIQRQPYIIISYRDIVKNVRAEAENNGLPKEQIEQIIADNTDLNYQAGDMSEYEVNDAGEDGKVLCLIRFWKQDGVVYFSKSTQNVVFCPPTKTPCKRYPIDGFWWDNIKGSARGLGEVTPLIPNQIEINKNLWRLSKTVQMSANPKMIYDKMAIPDIAKYMDSNAIGIFNEDVNTWKSKIGFLEAPPMRLDGTRYMMDLLNMTRELNGAGDIATGGINPERASGAAIAAVRDANALPLNGHVARAKKYIEDLALTWLDLKIAYSPNGIEVVTKDEEGNEFIETLDAKQVEKAKLSVQIDVAPANPWSRFKDEQEILNLWADGKLDALRNSEVVELLPNKGALAEKLRAAEERDEETRIEELVQKRMAQLQQQQQPPEGGMIPLLPQGMSQLDMGMAPPVDMQNAAMPPELANALAQKGIPL